VVVVVYRVRDYIVIKTLLIINLEFVKMLFINTTEWTKLYN